MSQNLQPRSATIYQFPLRRVRAAVPVAQPTSQTCPADAAPSQVAGASFGNGWYHEAAIEEEARRRAKS